MKKSIDINLKKIFKRHYKKDIYSSHFNGRNRFRKNLDTDTCMELWKHGEKDKIIYLRVSKNRETIYEEDIDNLERLFKLLAKGEVLLRQEITKKLVMERLES